MTHYDVIFAGGGLASTLTAYRLKAARPELRLLVVEAGDRLGANHTWSCHATDLTAEQNAWMAPFISYRWPGQYMFHAHISEFAELGWMGNFNAVNAADFPNALAQVGLDAEWDRKGMPFNAEELS